VWGEAGRSSSKGRNNQERSDLSVGVNNVGDGERIRSQRDAAPQGAKNCWAACSSGVLAIATAGDAQILGAATPQGGERQGGRRDPRGSCSDERGETSEGRVPKDDPA